MPSLDEQLEMIALYKLAQDPEALARKGPLSDAWDVVENITAFVDDIKNAFLATYDTNGNGFIDPGEEWESLQSSVKDIIVLVADINYDGKVEAQELAAVAQQFLGALNIQVQDAVCTQVIVDAEKSGIFLNLRPVLKHLYKKCTTFPA